MARSTTDVCLTLRPSTVQALDAAAQAARRSRSQTVDMLLSNALTGEDRLRALEEIAAAGLEASAAERAYRVRGPNPGQVIAESSTDGHDRLRALNRIAAANRKATR
jgi:hypothetical protein